MVIDCPDTEPVKVQRSVSATRRTERPLEQRNVLSALQMLWDPASENTMEKVEPVTVPLYPQEKKLPVGAVIWTVAIAPFWSMR